MFSNKVCGTWWAHNLSELFHFKVHKQHKLKLSHLPQAPNNKSKHNSFFPFIGNGMQILYWAQLPDSHTLNPPNNPLIPLLILINPNQVVHCDLVVAHWTPALALRRLQNALVAVHVAAKGDKGDKTCNQLRFHSPKQDPPIPLTLISSTLSVFSTFASKSGRCRGTFHSSRPTRAPRALASA